MIIPSIITTQTDLIIVKLATGQYTFNLYTSDMSVSIGHMGSVSLYQTNDNDDIIVMRLGDLQFRIDFKVLTINTLESTATDPQRFIKDFIDIINAL